MAYDIQRLEEALINADKAEDAAAAKVFADKIREMRATEQPIEPPVEAVEPTLGEEALSYGASVLSGLTALPRGAAQLGVRTGEILPDWLKYEFTGEYPDQGIELTEPVKQEILARGGELPQYQEPDIYPTTIAGQQRIVEELKKKAGREGFDVPEMIGMIASPASLMKTGIARAEGFIPKVAEGMKTGALYGAGMPVTGEGDFGREKVQQALIGMGMGGAIPFAAEPLKAIGRGIDQFTRPMAFRNVLGEAADYASGKMGGIKRDLQEIVGDMLGESRGKVTKAMMEAQAKPISGMPTAAQAVAGAQREGERFGAPLARLESDVARKTQAADPMQTRYLQQQAAREKALTELSGAAESRAAMEAARGAEANKLYGEAFNQTAKVDPELAKLATDPFVKKALPDAINLAQSKGINPKDNLPEFLHFVKIGLDKQLSRTGDEALQATEKKAVQGVKDKLVGWLGKKVPAYEQARATFAEMSQPINQAQIAQAVKEKIGIDIGDQSIKPFLKAMNEQAKLIKGAKVKGKELEDVYKSNPEALKTLKNVVDELETELTAKRMAGEVETQFGAIKGGVEPRIPGMLERSVVLTNALLNKISKDKTGEYAKELARLLQNPNEFAALLNAPTSGPLVRNTMAMFNQLSKAAPMEAAKTAGEQ